MEEKKVKKDKKEIKRSPRKKAEHNPNNKMAETIKILMVKRDLNKKQLADLLGVENASIVRKFRINDFNETELRAIAEALNCDLEIKFTLRDTGETF